MSRRAMNWAANRRRLQARLLMAEMYAMLNAMDWRGVLEACESGLITPEQGAVLLEPPEEPPPNIEYERDYALREVRHVAARIRLAQDTVTEVDGEKIVRCGWRLELLHAPEALNGCETILSHEEIGRPLAEAVRDAGRLHVKCAVDLVKDIFGWEIN